MRAPIRLTVALAAATAGIAAPRASGEPITPDTTSIYTLQGENASITSARLSDRYYTNGIRLGFTSSPGVPDFLATLGHTLYGDGVQRLSFDLTQQIYTPRANTVRTPPPGDRPYAGVLLGHAGLITDSADTRSTLGLALGVVGPAALGEEVQNGFHDLIGQKKVQGWHTQLRNEPLVEITSARTWRLPTGEMFGLETDALPALEAGVGNLRIYAQAGGTLRLGQGLAADFGTARIRPGLSGGDAFQRVRPFAWYVFLGADAQGVARDLTIEGNDFRSGPSAKLKPLVGEVEGGLALMAFGARLTYTHVVQTQEFRHQKGGLHQFGSLALSVRF